MKSCPKEEILQAYLDSELAVEADAAVRAHLEACSPCAAKAQEIEQEFAVLSNAFVAELPDAVPSARLRARIETALAEKAAPKLVWTQLFWRFGWVAAVLLVGGIAGWVLLGTDSNKQPQQVHIEKLTPSVTPEARQPLPPRPERRPEIAQQLPRHGVRRDSTTRRDEEVEVVTQFFALREGVDLTALENEQILRVELPGSALSEAGFPVDFETAQTSVKADVVLGQDGLARAIRFVR